MMFQSGKLIKRRSETRGSRSQDRACVASESPPRGSSSVRARSASLAPVAVTVAPRSQNWLLIAAPISPTPPITTAWNPGTREKFELNTCKQVRDPEHLKVFANRDAPEGERSGRRRLRIRVLE